MDFAAISPEKPRRFARTTIAGASLLVCVPLAWAAKVPDLGENGSVEVRPVMDYEAAGYEEPEAAESSRG